MIKDEAIELLYDVFTTSLEIEKNSKNGFFIKDMIIQFYSYTQERHIEPTFLNFGKYIPVYKKDFSNLDFDFEDLQKRYNKNHYSFLNNPS